MPSISNTSSSNNSSDSLGNSPNTKGITVYERVKAIYLKDSLGKVVYQRSFGNETIESISHLFLENLSFENFGLFKRAVCLEKTSILWETEQSGGLVRGILTQAFEPNEFEKWFLHLIASSAHMPIVRNPNVFNAAELIVNEFVAVLKKSAKIDKWETQGREFFKNKVEFFVSKGITVEAVLPAFPCKSSNRNKVATTEPDKGEELALRRLIHFAKKVKEVYSPGIIVWIVSDGHVFSDCIGVDDQVVDTYNLKVKALYESIKPSGEDPIKFASLKDIFNFDQYPLDRNILENLEVIHYLDTNVDKFSELCRKVLTHSCDTDTGSLKEDIRSVNHPRLYLYRGFSKFMMEDLALHPSTASLTRKQFKKVVSRVAFEMIKRNDAYSNLVDLMFPFHLRFSIHAHPNSGPKFGISLWNTEECSVIKSLESNLSPNSDDLLHIPTPWHNCVLQVEGNSKYFVVIYEVIKSAMDKGTHIVKWDHQEKYFLLKRAE